jgi:predicted transposase YdaD
VSTQSYDPAIKALVETEPESWPTLFGRPTGPTEVIDADIATVSGAADKVLRVSADPPYLLHLEFVAGHDAAALPQKLHVRNALLEDRHDMPVRSGAVLLRREADSPQLTGVYERGFPGEELYLTFRYQVVRVWRLPPEPLLTGGLALLPLALVSAVTESELPGIIQRMGRRLNARRGRRQAQVIWAAAYILLGLRYTPALASQIFRGVVSMKESSTYQAIVEEGRVEGIAQGMAKGLANGAVAEAKKVLRLLGDEAFGTPDSATAAAIEQLDNLVRLEDLLRRVRTAASWRELFGPSSSGRRRGGRRSTV